MAMRLPPSKYLPFLLSILSNTSGYYVSSKAFFEENSEGRKFCWHLNHHSAKVYILRLIVREG